jgi:hypothetical protein
MRTLKSIRRYIATWFGLEDMHIGDAIMLVSAGVVVFLGLWAAVAFAMGVF